MNRYLQIWRTQLRTSLTLAMQYRANFIIDVTVGLAWNALTLVPLIVLFDKRESVGGWDRASALVVMAYFMAIKAVIDGVIGPSLMQLVDGIRTGGFDYVLLKPIDAQFMMTAANYRPEKVFDLLAAIAVAVYAFAARGHGPEPAELALGLAMFVVGVLAAYALWTMCAALAFWVVRIETVLNLLDAVFDASRWPVQIFRGVWRIALTFVIPVALMTTYPAMALLGRLDAHLAIATVGAVVLILAISRLVWRAAVRNYTSASS